MTVTKVDPTRKFKIPERELDIDGQKIRVRGMTYSETKRFRETFRSDKEAAVPLVAHMCTLEPALSVEEAAEAPTHVLMAINNAVFELSGMRDTEGAGDEKKG